jgi:putative ABC transport system permease protein
MMRTLSQDVRYALRVLLKQPGFTVVAVVTLALGVGANSAIFSVVDAALLRPLPFKDPARLVQLWETSPRKDFERREASYPDFLDWRRDGREFDSVAGYTPAFFTLAGPDGPERVQGAAVTPNFFDTLGVAPARGRDFSEADDAAGGPCVVILSHGLWQRRYGGDEHVVGQSVTTGAGSCTVAGVLPASFSFAGLGDAEMWTTLQASPQQASARYWHWLQVVARLKPGATLQSARAQMQTVAARIAADDPQSHADTGISVVPLQEEFVGQLRPVLFALLGAVGLVLLIACANVANLLLARSTARRREIAVRAALGASRWRIVRQLLTESVLLSLAGGVAGLVLALWGVDLLVAAIPASQLAHMPYLRQLSPDANILLFTFGLSLLTGVVFGLAPALAASRADLHEAIKEGARGTGARRARGLRDLLVVSEVALSLVLLVGAGLLLKSLARMLSVDPGFRTENLLTMTLQLPPARAADTARAAAFYDELLRRASALPGVRGAAEVSNLPLSGDGGTGTPRVLGLSESATEGAESYLRTVSANYFGVMGVPLLKGRDFDERDRADAPPVVVVNQTFAARVFRGADPLGRRITFKFTANQPPFEIVGVVGDEKVSSLDARTSPVIYFPVAQGPDGRASLVLRTTADPSALAGSVRGVVRELDPEVPVFNVRTMEQVISDSRATFMRRYPAYLIGVFAVVALLLAVVGIYGVISYTVTQRTRELAIRLALGARGRDVLRLVVGHGLLLALAGVGAGLAASLALTRLMAGMLFGVSAADPAVYGAVALLLVAVALLACALPARRASKVDPTVALRYE